MKTLLLITIALFTLSARGQVNNIDTTQIIRNQLSIFNQPFGISTIAFECSVIDSTAMAPDTTYSVKANVPYMEVSRNFQNGEKKWWQSTVTYKYNGKSWDVSGMALKYSDLLNSQLTLSSFGAVSTSICLSCGAYSIQPAFTSKPIKKSKKK